MEEARHVWHGVHEQAASGWRSGDSFSCYCFEGAFHRVDLEKTWLKVSGALGQSWHEVFQLQRENISWPRILRSSAKKVLIVEIQDPFRYITCMHGKHSTCFGIVRTRTNKAASST